MASRLGRSIFSQAAHPCVRVIGRTAGVSKRCMSSTTDTAKKSSDLPWMIGSAVVFGPAAVWLLLPQSNKSSHAVAAHHEDSARPGVGHGEASSAETHSMKDSEGTQASSEEVDASMKKAFVEDSPKDAQAAEEREASGSEQSAMTVSGEAKDSIQQGFNEDLPDAQAAEKKAAKGGDEWESGASGQTSEAESQPEPKENTASKKTDEQPTNMGDARKTAKGGDAPKESGASK